VITTAELKKQEGIADKILAGVLAKGKKGK